MRGALAAAMRAAIQLDLRFELSPLYSLGEWRWRAVFIRAKENQIWAEVSHDPLQAVRAALKALKAEGYQWD